MTHLCSRTVSTGDSWKAGVKPLRGDCNMSGLFTADTENRGLDTKKESNMKQTPSLHRATELTPAELQLAEDTFSFCMEHKQEHFTISFLAERAGVSPTKLKQEYRRVYGISLFAHIRREKMLFAARELGNH